VGVGPLPKLSLYQKFALVIILLGIVPIALLSTVLQNRLFQEYERSLYESYEQGLRYASYSLEQLFGSYNDISKFSYYYNMHSAEGSFSYDYINYDNLRRILIGEEYPEETREERIGRDMDTFLRNIVNINSTIEAAHFIHEPDGESRREYHRGNYNASIMEGAAFTERLQLHSLNRGSRELIIIPTHPFDYAQASRKRTDRVFTVARNYFNLTLPVGQETYVGTLFVDYDALQIAEIIAGIDLYEQGTLFVTNGQGDCFFSSDDAMTGQRLDLRAYAPQNGGMLLRQDVNGYDLSVWFFTDHRLVDSRMLGVQRVMYLVVGLAVAALSLGSIVFSRRMTKPIRTMMKQMEQVESGRFQGELPVTSQDEIGLLSARFNQMSRELENYTNQVYVAKIRQTEAELTALKSQIYPHFLYNTLEVIRMTAVGEGDEKVANMVEALGDQIRYLIGLSGDVVTLRQEISNLEKYIYLINCRFNNKVAFSADKNGLESYIPKLILQPLVENAYMHGIKPKDGPGRIHLTITCLEDVLEITVLDNGVGMGETTIREIEALLASDVPGKRTEGGWESIGLKNVHDRLRFLYGEPHGVSLFSSQAGTAVKITLPGNIEPQAGKDDGNASHGFGGR
jgi:two-component system sensor histidine kinase YesM